MHEQLLTCPGCDLSPLDVSVEDGEMLFFCENCGWQRIERNYFYITAWDVEIRRALAPIDILQSLLASQEVVTLLRGRLRGPSHLSNPAVLDFGVASDTYLLGEVQIALQVYMKQMIVLAITYLEQVLQDFFRCQFLSNPQRMHGYLSPEGKGQARIALNDILRAVSKEELIVELAEQAAKEAVGTKPHHRILEKLIRECRLDIHLPVVDDLRELVELRNRIVHENTNEEITAPQVYSSFGLLLYVLYILGRAAVEYRMAFWDDFGFLYKFETQLSERKHQRDITVER